MLNTLSIVTKLRFYLPELTREAIEIEKHINNFNLVDGYKLK